MTNESTVEHPEVHRLASAPLFAGLNEADVTQIAAQMRLTRLDVGDVAIREGGDSSKLFVILEGNVTVHRQGRHLADLGPGDAFGEAGVRTLHPRNATVIATTEAEVAVLMGWDFRTLTDRFPAIGENADAITQGRDT